jgi:hypothetical protein
MSSLPKVGVLTFHRCINYGSYWQARCLAEGLSARGYNTGIIDHDSRAVNLAEWKCGFRPVLPTPVPKSDYPLYRAKMEAFFDAFCTLPLSRRFDLQHPEEMESYDLVVVGSDEVWNLMHPWYGRCALFYGEGVRAQRLVSYAASFGNYDATWGLEPQWADSCATSNRSLCVTRIRDTSFRVLWASIPPLHSTRACSFFPDLKASGAGHSNLLWQCTDTIFLLHSVTMCGSGPARAIISW